MTDHRALQRALFRVQLDERFAERVFGRDEEAVASLELEERELSWLLEADPAAVRADRGQERRAQLIGNLTTEFSRSVWALEQDPHEFVYSDDFHTAITQDESLMLAFGNWLVALVPDSSELSGLVDLEREMARARRSTRVLPAMSAADILLAAACRVLSVPVGTHDWAVEIGVALESERRPKTAAIDRSESEFVLIQAGAPTVSGRRDVSVELLEPAVARLLDRAHTPLGKEERADLASSEGASPADLEDFIQTLVADGILVMGSPSST